MKYQKGDKVLVRAWWDKPHIIECEVNTTYYQYPDLDHDCIVVKPLNGNPHSRMIRISRDIVENNNESSRTTK